MLNYILWASIYKIGHLARNRLDSQELCLADAVVTATVDEIHVAELGEVDWLKTLDVKDSFLHLLYINILLVAIKIHHHNQPVVPIVTRME